MITHQITRKWSAGGSTISKTETKTGSGEQNIDQAVDADETDLLVSFALDVSTLKSIFIVANKDMTVTPHDSSDVAMDSVDLQSGVPYEWTDGSGLDNPFADDIGSLHVANLESAEGLLQIRSLYDSTPLTVS